MRRKLWLAAALVIVGLLLFEMQTRVLQGMWAGEAFYRGRPTSYWKGELWKCIPVNELDLGDGPRPGVLYRVTKWEEWLLDYTPGWSQFLQLLPENPPILEGDNAAFDVLLALLNDDAPDIRQLAAYGLRRLKQRAAVPALLKRLNDPDDNVRVHAEAALKNIDQ